MAIIPVPDLGHKREAGVCKSGWLAATLSDALDVAGGLISLAPTASLIYDVEAGASNSH